MARRARVSRQTVSNVLNSPHLVHPETRSRVERAIEVLRYRPHQAARSLRTHRSRLIGVRMEAFGDGINGSILDRFIHALTEVAEGHGYRVLVYTAADDASEIAAYENLLGTHEIDAFILTSTHRADPRTAWLASRNTPFVTFGRPWDGTEHHSWVDVDGAAGTREATRRLCALGHQRIAFLGWPEGSGVGDDRRAGWEDALRGCGWDPAALVVAGPDGVDEGREGAHRLLDGAVPPTAFVCASDSLALGAIGALSDLGLVPGPDLPVIGFDDTAVARAIGLTSLAQPLGQAAQLCVNLMAALLGTDPDGTSTRPAHHLLRPELVVRATGLGGPPTGHPTATITSARTPTS
ncbi:MAG: LacI family DNA-binding transcriptional regulator [Actinomycetes bacterium]